MYLYISIITDNEKITMHVDTGAEINIGNKGNYQLVTSQRPSMVAEYIECGVDTEYDTVQLLAALELKGTHNLLIIVI